MRCLEGLFLFCSEICKTIFGINLVLKSFPNSLTHPVEDQKGALRVLSRHETTFHERQRRIFEPTIGRGWRWEKTKIKSRFIADFYLF